MHSLILAAMDRGRAVMMILVLILISGMLTYQSIPKESDPDVQLPFIYVSLSHEGISPEDGERLLVRPMEKELQSIEGLKEMRATARQGHASIMLEFEAGFDSDKALNDVREKVDLAKPELPEEADEPTVNEINLSRFPVLNVIVMGGLPERALLRIARDLQDRIEALPGVLEAEIAGEREETVDIILDPLTLEQYGLTSSIIEQVRGNNLLVAAGQMDSGKGRYDVKVPGLLEDVGDIRNLPVKIDGDAVTRLGDIATIRKGFRDRTSIARVNGQSALVLEVSKRTGENIIATIAAVKAVVEEARSVWPEGVEVLYAQDQSDNIKQMVHDLENNVLLAVILVLLVVVAVIGLRSGILVALSIPGAFLFGILVIATFGVTLNIVVLFSLILSIGMLVDSAIVVVEYANRKMLDGMPHQKAYAEAATRMRWPLIASTITTLLAFAPLLFWPGIVGQFMQYMPMTLIATLTGSLLMALIFLPTLGTLIGRPDHATPATRAMIRATESGDLQTLSGLTGRYVTWLDTALSRPRTVLLVLGGAMLCILALYSFFGKGVEFFPDIEPENTQVLIRARGNLSVMEKDAVARKVEQRIFSLLQQEVYVFYTRAGQIAGDGRDVPEDTIALIQVELEDWQVRRPARAITDDIRARLADIPGIIVETQDQQSGPPSGKPINIEMVGLDREKLHAAASAIVLAMERDGRFLDIEDSRPVPAIEWELEADRALAARFGLDMRTIGNFIKMVTNGLVATTYRPDDQDEEVDILLRFPPEHRTISQLDRLRALTSEGAIPISNAVTRTAEPKTDKIERVDGLRVITIKADVAQGILADSLVQEMRTWVEEAYTNGILPKEVQTRFRGEDEDQKESGAFLSQAFILALFMMALVLVTQFNRFYHAFIILSAVFFSTIGVLLGLMVAGQPFGIVMCGVGVIALAGIVVNNNIIFIDTYQQLRNQGMHAKEALLRTGAQRMRPILLTAGTTVLGLLPMVLAMTLDFIGRDISFGAPSTQWWRQLSTSIAGGLSFATILTLFFTPCLLILGARKETPA